MSQVVEPPDGDPGSRFGGLVSEPDEVAGPGESKLLPFGTPTFIPNGRVGLWPLVNIP